MNAENFEYTEQNAPNRQKMPIKTFQGKNLGDIYGTDLEHFPKYPNYTPEEKAAFKNDPGFYEFDQPELASHAQVGRLFPIAGGAKRIYAPSTTNIPYLQQYMQETYGDQHTGGLDNIEYYKGVRGYIELFRQKTAQNNRIVFPHPYIPSHIDPSLSYLPAELLSGLNNKNNLGELSTKIPKRIITSIQEIRKQVKEQGFDYPFYIKGPTGNSGDDVRLITSEEDLMTAIGHFEKRNSDFVSVETNFPHHHNFNIQFVASPEGEISIVHCTEQKTSPEGKYLGNIFDFELSADQIPPQVIEVGYEATQKALEKGWYGLNGLDIPYNVDSQEAVVIDPNFRPNGSTTPNVLKERLSQIADGKFGIGYGVTPKKPSSIPQMMQNGLRKHLDNGQIFVIGGAQELEKGKFKMYVLLTGPSIDKITELKETLSHDLNF